VAAAKTMKEDESADRMIDDDGGESEDGGAGSNCGSTAAVRQCPVCSKTQQGRCSAKRTFNPHTKPIESAVAASCVVVRAGGGGDGDRDRDR